MRTHSRKLERLLDRIARHQRIALFVFAHDGEVEGADHRVRIQEAQRLAAASQRLEGTGHASTAAGYVDRANLILGRVQNPPDREAA